MKRLFLCVALLLSALAGESNAQWWGNGYGSSSYYNRGIYVDQDRIPYFALHPPVYYSHPVPRTYGYSPFAYPGNVPTPEFQPPRESGVLLNPFMNQEPVPSVESNVPTPAPAAKPRKTGALLSGPAKDKLSSVTPLRIANPFFEMRQVATGR